MLFRSKNKTILKTSASLVFLIILIKIASIFIIRSDWVLYTSPELSDLRMRLFWQRDYSPGQVTSYSIDSFDPLLGWKPRANSVTNYYDGTLISFGNDGIRGTKNYSLNKSIGTTRVVLIGDSFSFGENVSDSDTYAVKLEKLLSNTEILNFSVHGYGIDQMNLRLKMDAYKYHPDIVIYAFIGDDLSRSVRNFFNYVKPRYKLVNNNLQLTNVPIIKAPEYFRSVTKPYQSIFDTFNLIRERIAGQPDANPKINQISRAIFEQTYTDIKNNSAIPIFLYLPTGSEITDDLSNFSASEKLMFDFCQSKQMLCLSARPYLFAAHKNGVQPILYAHYEPRANEAVAQGLAGDLQQLKLFTLDNDSKQQTNTLSSN